MSYALLVLVVLLNPSPGAGNELISGFASVGQRIHAPAALVVPGRIEFGLNVLAFLPLTLLGSLRWPTLSVSTWTAAGFGGSLLVELVQATLPDRMATHADVVANTLGAALGALAAWIVLRAVRQ